jgi:predicted nucleotidyltransferase
MVTKRQIQGFARRIAARCRPQRIILFGSYAYGQPTADSDVDMLVVMPFRGEGYLKAAEIHLALNPAFSVDLLVRTPAQLAKRLRLGHFFLLEVTERGIVLYETADNRMDKKHLLLPPRAPASSAVKFA